MMAHSMSPCKSCQFHLIHLVDLEFLTSSWHPDFLILANPIAESDDRPSAKIKCIYPVGGFLERRQIHRDSGSRSR